MRVCPSVVATVIVTSPNPSMRRRGPTWGAIEPTVTVAPAGVVTVTVVVAVVALLVLGGAAEGDPPGRDEQAAEPIDATSTRAAAPTRARERRGRSDSTQGWEGRRITPSS